MTSYSDDFSIDSSGGISPQWEADALASAAGGVGTIQTGPGDHPVLEFLPAGPIRDFEVYVELGFDGDPPAAGEVTHGWAIFRGPRPAAFGHFYFLEHAMYPRRKVWQSQLIQQLPHSPPLKSSTVPTVSGDLYAIRTRVTTTGASTRLQSRLWAAGDPEPTAWLHDVSDSTPGYNVAGPLGLLVTTAPATKPAGGKPPKWSHRIEAFELDVFV